MAVIERTSPTEGVVLLTLNRPSSLNSMTAELVHSLHEHIHDIAVDPTALAPVGYCHGSSVWREPRS